MYYDLRDRYIIVFREVLRGLLRNVQDATQYHNLYLSKESKNN